MRSSISATTLSKLAPGSKRAMSSEKARLEWENISRSVISPGMGRRWAIMYSMPARRQ